MARKIKMMIPALLAAFVLAAPALAGAASTKTCTEAESPHKNFTTTYTQTPSCNSSSNVNESPQTATNKGGNTPAGQQP